MKKVIAIVHIPEVFEGHPEMWESFLWQQDCAHRHGLKVTLIVPYDTFRNPSWAERLKAYEREFGDEIGLEFGLNRELQEKFGAKDSLYHLPLAKRWEVIRFLFEEFRKAFGRYPTSVASIQMDAPTLKFVKEKYPEVEVAVATCFEEGVNVYHGCTPAWFNFNEGGPWWPWLPSEYNSLAPAAVPEEEIGLVGVPWLNRDMIQSFDSRNDWYSSELGDLLRSKSIGENDMSYLYEFIDQWLEQARYNGGFSFYTMLQESSWLDPRKPPIYDEPYYVARKLYDKYLAFLARKRKEDPSVEVMCLTEFARWFRRSGQGRKPHICLWRDIRFASGKQYLWYIDGNLRLTLDMNRGGSIVDLRPYAAKVEKFTGVDSPWLYDGSYPYIVQSHHRNHSLYTCWVSAGGRRLPLSSKRTRCSNVLRSEGFVRIETEPVRLDLGVRLSLRTNYIVRSDGTLLVEREVMDSSDRGAEVTLEEELTGCWGTTDYPAEMRGIRLKLLGESDRELVFSYLGRELKAPNVRWVGAYIPQIDCSVVLRPLEGPASGWIEEGYLFKPFFTLRLSMAIGARKGNRAVAELSLRKGGLEGL